MGNKYNWREDIKPFSAAIAVCDIVCKEDDVAFFSIPIRRIDSSTIAFTILPIIKSDKGIDYVLDHEMMMKYLPAKEDDDVKTVVEQYLDEMLLVERQTVEDIESYAYSILFLDIDAGFNNNRFSEIDGSIMISNYAATISDIIPTTLSVDIKVVEDEDGSLIVNAEDLNVIDGEVEITIKVIV